MKPTKKKPTLPDKVPQNKLKIIKTNDEKQFKIIDSLLMKYSLFFKNIVEDDKNQEQVIKLPNIDSETFEVINQFFTLHKDKQPSKIQLPIKSNQQLKNIIDESDAILVQKIMAKGDEFFSRILQATSYLQVEELKKRMIAGLAIKLMKNTVSELKQQHDIKQNDFKDEEIREEVQRRIKIITQHKEEI